MTKATQWLDVRFASKMDRFYGKASQYLSKGKEFSKVSTCRLAIMCLFQHIRSSVSIYQRSSVILCCTQDGVSAARLWASLYTLPHVEGMQKLLPEICMSDSKLRANVCKKFTYARSQTSEGELPLSYVQWLACLPPSNVVPFQQDRLATPAGDH